jgi:hypothetical protein
MDGKSDDRPSWAVRKQRDIDELRAAFVEVRKSFASCDALWTDYAKFASGYGG